MAQSKIIPISGGFHVWTRKVGKSPIKILLLHGGPGCTHEYLEPFEEYLSDEFEIYFYDQLGSYYSDQPNDPSLWTIERFREELEEVRQHLDLENFYLYGNSWGGMLGIEYALKYQVALKGLIISNMTASIPSYIKYINVLKGKLPKEIVQKMTYYEDRGDYENRTYQKIVSEHLDKKHVCRLEQWPDSLKRTLYNINQQVFTTMQGPNEFLVNGTFKDWDRWDDLHKIKVPTLLVGGRHDTMSVEDKNEMGRRIPHSKVVICENGSHTPMWEDQDYFFTNIKKFVNDVELNSFV